MFIDKFDNLKRNVFQSSQVNETYVYFLMLENEVVYVGKSVFIESRLKAHRKDGKVFSSVEYIVVPNKYAFEIEYYFIRKYNPIYNSQTEPFNGFGNVNKLKKPTSTTSRTLEFFILVNNLKPFSIIDGEPYFTQEYIEKKWSEIYGSYRLLTKLEIEDLNKEYLELKKDLNNN